MAVDPKLATLMRVIDDNQDKMTEGEYLEAMNGPHSIAKSKSNKFSPRSSKYHLVHLLLTKHPLPQGYLRLECQKS
jgi:hypothetical protein